MSRCVFASKPKVHQKKNGFGNKDFFKILKFQRFQQVMHFRDDVVMLARFL